MRVRALVTIKWDGKYRVPGQPTELFDLPDEVAEVKLGLGQIAAVEELEVPEAPPEVELPEDLPYRSVIEGLGLSLEALSDIEDLTTLDGIGEKSAGVIARYLDR